MHKHRNDKNQYAANFHIQFIRSGNKIPVTEFALLNNPFAAAITLSGVTAPIRLGQDSTSSIVRP